MPDNWYKAEALHFAVQDGDLEKVRELVDNGYDVNSFDEGLCRTPLHYAVIGEEFKIAAFLLESGADVNARDEEHIGETPLNEIAANCSYEMAEFLVNAGADPTVPGWMGLSALDRASERKKPEGRRVYELFIKRAGMRSALENQYEGK